MHVRLAPTPFILAALVATAITSTIAAAIMAAATMAVFGAAWRVYYRTCNADAWRFDTVYGSRAAARGEVVRLQSLGNQAMFR